MVKMTAEARTYG